MKSSILTTLSLALALVATPAFADQEDKDACAGRAQGDACTRGDGDAGTCVPDDSDPVLTCEDDVGASSGSGTSSGSSSSSSDGDDDGDDSSSGCAAGGDPGAPLVALLLAGATAALMRRRAHA